MARKIHRHEPTARPVERACESSPAKCVLRETVKKNHRLTGIPADGRETAMSNVRAVSVRLAGVRAVSVPVAGHGR
jgi:hypothetical protein